MSQWMSEAGKASAAKAKPRDKAELARRALLAARKHFLGSCTFAACGLIAAIWLDWPWALATSAAVTAVVVRMTFPQRTPRTRK